MINGKAACDRPVDTVRFAIGNDMLSQRRMIGDNPFFQARETLYRAIQVTRTNHLFGQTLGTKKNVMVATYNDYGCRLERCQTLGAYFERTPYLVSYLRSWRIRRYEHYRVMRHPKAADYLSHGCINS